MQKRLTARDWILYFLLLMSIALSLLLMWQVDRQWLRMAEMQTVMKEQAQSLRELRTSATNSMPTVAATPAVTADTEVATAFRRAKTMVEKPDYAQGDWSVNAFGNNLKSLTPFIAGDAYSSEVQGYVLESLLTRDPDTLEWQGFIAKSWQVSPDGLTITFQLRDDVTFSDGTPLTAEDVVFTFNFIMTEAIEAPRLRAYLEKIKEVKANGKYEVVFNYKEPYFEALDLAGGLNILPKHFYGPYLQKPQAFNESKGLLLGSGPYRLLDPNGWTPDKGHVELVRNDRYWGDVQPSYNRLLWKIIQNESAMLVTYRNGELDGYEAKSSEYDELKQDSQLMGKSQNFEYMSSIEGYSYIGWNQQKDGKPTPFADKRVRQALSYLTDVGRIINDIYLGYAEVAVSPFNPTSKQHDPALKPYGYNLKKAQVLLKDAGYEDRNKDGVLEDATGKPFTFKLTYFEAREDTKRMVLLLRDLYAKAGVKLEPNPQEWPVMLDALKKKSFDAITLGWSGGIEGDLYQIFHSKQAQANGDNATSYQNPELDKLIEKARSTVDEAQRMPIWQQAERILYEDQPYTFLVRKKKLYFIDKRIQNVMMTKYGVNWGALPMENYVPLGAQRYKD